jgi:hypothetical protein
MAYAFNGAGSPPRSIPTTLDSLNIYNNALKVLNYYKGKQYKRYPDTEIAGFNPFNELDSRNKNWEIKIKNNEKVSVPSGLKFAKDITYRKDFDANRFMQRDLASGVLDTQAPAPLYDKRIMPTMLANFENIDENSPLKGDIVNVYLYDPLKVKPVKALTPQERILRGLGPKPVQQIPTQQNQPVFQIKKLTDLSKLRKQYPDIEMMEGKQAALESGIDMEQGTAKPIQMNRSKERDNHMGYALRYPMLQSALEKLKMRIKGEPMLPYWVDERGIKRYPAYGENNPAEVRMNRLVTGDLNPNNPEDAMEIERFKTLLRQQNK